MNGSGNNFFLISSGDLRNILHLLCTINLPTYIFIALLYDSNEKTLYSFTDVANASISDLDLTEKFVKLSTEKTNEKKDEIHSGITSSCIYIFHTFLKGRVLQLFKIS